MLENQVMADAASNEQIPTARDYLERHKIAGEVLIADNGSSDGSQEIATNSGARVVPIPERGL
ncbi:MAG: glycosyl transferase [Microcystis aeruginosa LG13-03]|nr:glycosyl transferase [Microcystis aeruginosa LG13-03]